MKFPERHPVFCPICRAERENKPLAVIEPYDEVIRAWLPQHQEYVALQTKKFNAGGLVDRDGEE